MIIIHSVQKLLNTSRLKPAKYLSAASQGQELHSWYARLLATGFIGKLLVMYVHEPSLLIIICRGKTVQGTIPQFFERLPSLLGRFNFIDGFIEKEMVLIREGYVVSKTNSKSMLARINAMVVNIEWNCSRYQSYDSIDLDEIEDIYMHWLTFNLLNPGEMKYTIEYWKEKGLVD
jgi:hypothetical protein